VLFHFPTYRQTKEEQIEEVPRYCEDQGTKVQEGEIDDELKSDAGVVVYRSGVVMAVSVAMAMAMAQAELVTMMMWGLLSHREIQSP
jgi:hypothetical protein